MPPFSRKTRALAIDIDAPTEADGIRVGRVGLTTVGTDPWRAVGFGELANTVRRICTQCGWGQDPAGSGQLLAVTSAVPREGKSTIARALAISTAQDHAADVLLLECDMLNPTLAIDFEVETAPGLAELLSRDALMDDVIRPSGLSNLWLLPAGVCQSNPSRLLRSGKMSTLLQSVRERFSFVVLDLPAVLASSDATVLTRQSDGAVFIIRAGFTDQIAVQRALELLTGTALHGVVLNRWRTRMPDIVRRIVAM